MTGGGSSELAKVRGLVEELRRVVSEEQRRMLGVGLILEKLESRVEALEKAGMKVKPSSMSRPRRKAKPRGK